MTKCYKTKPTAVYVSKGNKCKDSLYYTAVSKKFDNFIFVCICFNTICMAVTWYQQPQAYTDVMEYVNYVFGIIYTVECVIKISVFGKLYF
jgi:voltage-dependent calcium channel L type alpha-1D